MICQIIRAKKEDLNEVLKLEKEWIKEKISPGVIVNETKVRLKELNKSYVLIAKKDTIIIAYLEAEIVKAKRKMPAYGIKEGDRYCELNVVFVKNSYRSQGVGKLLVRELINYCKSIKIKKIKLKAANNDLYRLINFYKELGFKEIVADMLMELKWS